MARCQNSCVHSVSWTFGLWFFQWILVSFSASVIEFEDVWVHAALDFDSDILETSGADANICAELDNEFSWWINGIQLREFSV